MNTEGVRKESLGLGIYLMAAMFGGVAGWGASALHMKQNGMSGASNPMVIVDYAAIIMGSDQEDVQTIADGLREQIRRLSEAGYVVLDANAVLGAPENVPVIDAFVRE
jgi:hypothetical protein